MYSNNMPFEYAKEYIDILPKVPKWFEDKGCSVLKKRFIGNKEYVVFEENIQPDIKERFLKECTSHLQRLEEEHSNGIFSDNLIQ